MGWDDCARRAKLVSLGSVATDSLGVWCRLRLRTRARVYSGARSVSGDWLSRYRRTDYRGGGRGFVVVIWIYFRLGPAGSRRDAREAETEHKDRNAGKLQCVHVYFTLGRDSVRV
jgi:hypothetical protein